MAAPKEQAEGIRIIKRKNGHDGHHGGAWKVAYADFVTAMMAFFLVMWIVGLSPSIKKAVEGYFKDPIGFMKAVNAGRSPFKISDGGTGKTNATSISKTSNDAAERSNLMRAQQVLEKIIQDSPKFKDLKNHIEIKLVKEGLKIDLLDDRKSNFFDSASATVKPAAATLLSCIAQELKTLPNSVIFEGHTDPRPLVGRPGYTNWELSTDRANAARRIMQTSGLRADQVAQVRGFAATQPRDPLHPYSYTNRRVSIIVMFSSAVKSQEISSQLSMPSSSAFSISSAPAAAQ